MLYIYRKEDVRNDGCDTFVLLTKALDHSAKLKMNWFHGNSVAAVFTYLLHVRTILFVDKYK